MRARDRSDSSLTCSRADRLSWSHSAVRPDDHCDCDGDGDGSSNTHLAGPLAPLSPLDRLVDRLPGGPCWQTDQLWPYRQSDLKCKCGVRGVTFTVPLALLGELRARWPHHERAWRHGRLRLQLASLPLGNFVLGRLDEGRPDLVRRRWLRASAIQVSPSRATRLSADRQLAVVWR